MLGEGGGIPETQVPYRNHTPSYTKEINDSSVFSYCWEIFCALLIVEACPSLVECGHLSIIMIMNIFVIINILLIYLEGKKKKRNY